MVGPGQHIGSVMLLKLKRYWWPNHAGSHQSHYCRSNWCDGKINHTFVPNHIAHWIEMTRPCTQHLRCGLLLSNAQLMVETCIEPIKQIARRKNCARCQLCSQRLGCRSAVRPPLPAIITNSPAPHHPCGCAIIP
jgi:hypothetical protein